MDIYVYSDESSVFDYVHQDYYTFGGLIFINSQDKITTSINYKRIEDSIRKNCFHNNKNIEIKSSKLNPNNKRRLYNTLSNNYKFGVIIKLKQVDSSIFIDSLSKQRYLDYAYKRALKEALLNLQSNHIIDLNLINNIYVYNDEHTIASNGYYDLEKSIYKEFTQGMHKNNKFIPPIANNLNQVRVSLSNSEHNILIRASDIIANKLFHDALKNRLSPNNNINEHVIILP